jgi:hypothetical protein
MHHCWDLPSEEMMSRTAREWLLNLLAKLNETQRLMALMVPWRSWRVRNKIILDKPVKASRRFLCKYVHSVLMINHCPKADACRGSEVQMQKACVRPASGRLKLNFH